MGLLQDYWLSLPWRADISFLLPQEHHSGISCSFKGKKDMACNTNGSHALASPQMLFQRE